MAPGSPDIATLPRTMVFSEERTESNDSIAEALEACKYNRKFLVMCRETFLVFWLMLASTTCNYTNILCEHRCDAGSAVFACAIPDFLYIPGQNSSRVVEPNSTATRKLSISASFGIRTRFNIRKYILAYDAALHNQLQRPKAVRLFRTKLELVEIPIDLEYGEFSRSYIKEIIVPLSETPHPLRYLDLHANLIVDTRNLSTLVNLETLILSGNRLTRVTNQVFQRMTNLTTLIISMNRIFELSFNMLPPRLEKIFAHINLIESVDFSEAYLPALEVLTLHYGYLKELNVTAVLAAAPILKKIMLQRNEFGLEKEKNISAALNAAGVSHDEGFGKEKLKPNEYVRSHGSDDDYDDDSFYRDRKVQFWEHTFAWLLGIGNVIVVVWAAVDGYKRKQQAA